MKTAMTSSARALLALAACGGSAGTEQEPLSAPTAAGAAEAECTPVDACDPDRPLFCTAGDACYLLYPNQQKAPVSCLARPAPRTPASTTRRCP